MTKAQEFKKELSALKRKMKAAGIRITSCFNGGLSSEEREYNTQLFALKTELEKVSI